MSSAPTIPCGTCQSPTECAGDRECYLWRCENPHAPAPETDDAEVTS